jgi:hypothetical protein
MSDTPKIKMDWALREQVVEISRALQLYQAYLNGTPNFPENQEYIAKYEDQFVFLCGIMKRLVNHVPD